MPIPSGQVHRKRVYPLVCKEPKRRPVKNFLGASSIGAARMLYHESNASPRNGSSYRSDGTGRVAVSGLQGGRASRERFRCSPTMSSSILRRGRHGQLFRGLSGRTPVRREVADGSRKGLWSINATTSHAAYRRPRLAP